MKTYILNDNLAPLMDITSGRCQFVQAPMQAGNVDKGH
jgi:hypothetical protein